MDPNCPDPDAPWKARFRAPRLLSLRVAAGAPTRALLIGNYRCAAPQALAWELPGGEPRPLTDDPDGVPEAWLDPAGRHVYFLRDQGGSEIGHLVRVPFAGGEAEDVTPELPPYTLRGVHLSASGNCLGLNPVNAAGFQLYCLDLGPTGGLGIPRRVYCSPWETWRSILSHGGELVAAQSTARARGMRRYSTIVLDTHSGEQVAELWDGPECSVEPVLFSPRAGDLRLLATSTRSGYRRPLLWDPRRGERRDLPLETLPGDVLPLDWSTDGQQVLLNHIHRARQQLYLYDMAAERLVRLEHPAGGFSSYELLSDGEARLGPPGQVLALWQNSTHPPQVLALDCAGVAPPRTALAPGQVPPGHPWQSVTITSSDGQDVQGWLGRPDGPGPFPTILEVHGGPHAVVLDEFHAGSQAWIDNGFAYLTLNFRGSTTFGRAFREQIWGDLGHWEVEDMAAAREWLVAQGIARPEAVFLHGWSYGGYLTLLGLGKRPDLWAGGMAMTAIADWTLNYQDASDALKGAFRAWHGGTPEEKPQQYAASSPIRYVQDVRAPLLIVQGRNDTRTTPRQIELYEARMRALGKEIEVDWFDAGHGRGGTEQEIAFQERLLGFARRVLEGLDEKSKGAHP